MTTFVKYLVEGQLRHALCFLLRFSLPEGSEDSSARPLLLPKILQPRVVGLGL